VLLVNVRARLLSSRTCVSWPPCAQAAGGQASAVGHPGAVPPPQPQPQHAPQNAALPQTQDDEQQPLQQVAAYLASAGAAGPAAVSAAATTTAVPHGGGAAGGGAGAAAGGGEGAAFRPGWEDIFRMNQQQLEAAIHRCVMSGDKAKLKS
jgi:hypothetical protein